jgi:hypothetical protein
VVHKYAVLIAGGINGGNNHGRYWHELKTMYNILKNRGYAAADITVIYDNGVAATGEMPVNYAATPANVTAAFTQLAAKVTATDKVFIFTDDHGGGGAPDASGDEAVTHHDEALCLWAAAGEQFVSCPFTCYMKDDDVAAAVNKLNASATVIVVMEQCYSGGQLDDLTKPNRVMMSAASATEPSWGYSQNWTDWNEFTYWWFAAITGSRPDGAGAVNADTNGDGKISMLEAFNFARSHDGANETPQYEDNGTLPAHSGTMPAGGEGTLGADTFLD